eukprot:gb/GECG01011662.1/.p1 GENE.gb/GECG01011662.1/~~gb/GECG01011662.1/.p1  ORF type:complete len:520 (+),score=69.60 gb/GECG01011662.1/:1-1560(+)
MQTTPVRPRGESSTRPSSSKQRRRRNNPDLGRAELKRLIACSEHRKVFVRCGEGTRESKLARVLESTPSIARLPKDLYAGTEPAGEIQSWRGSLRPHNTRNTDLEELMDFGFQEDVSYTKNFSPRGSSRRRESSSSSPWGAHRQILQTQCEQAEQRSDQRVQQTLSRYAKVEELPTYGKDSMLEKKHPRQARRSSVDSSDKEESLRFSSRTRNRSASGSRPHSAVQFVGSSKQRQYDEEYNEVFDRSQQAVQEMKETEKSIQKSKYLMSKQLQQDLGRFVYEFPQRYAAKYKAFSGPNELDPREGIESMRLEHEYETLKRQLHSQRMYKKVIQAVPSGKNELSCVDRVFLHVIRLALHKCIVLSATNVFLLLDRLHLEVMILSKRDNLFHKYTGPTDPTVFQHYIPEDDMFDSTRPATASTLGLEVEPEISLENQESIFAHLRDEDVKQVLGSISEEDAPYWPVALKKPIKVLLNSLDVSPDRYLRWLQWKKLKIPLKDRLQSHPIDSAGDGNQQTGKQ